MSTREAVIINTPADREKVVRWARGVSDGTIVEFRKSTRSHEQNAKMHAMLGEVSDQVVWYGQKLKVEDWKNMFTASLRKASVVPGIDPGTVVPLGIHTSTMTIDEMSDMIELIYAFGAENNVTFKEPKPDNTNSDDELHAPSSDNAGMTPVDEAGAGDVPASDAPASTDPERDILIRFAAEMLPMAATAPAEAWKEVEKGWSEGEMKKLSATGLDKAKAISMSLRAIAKGNTSLESAVEYYAEVLDCKISDLGGVDG
jgi:hypothetical protein